MQSEALAELVGRNARRLRGRTSAEAVAREARLLGAPWGTSRVSGIERGRMAVTVENLVVLSSAISLATGDDVRIGDLIAPDSFGAVDITPTLQMTPEDVAGVLASEDVPAWERARKVRAIVSELDAAVNDERPSELAWALARTTVADERAAERVGMDVETLTARAVEMWGRPLSAERDRRAEPGANAQRLGRITRELLDEIRAAAEGNDTTGTEAPGNGDH